MSAARWKYCRWCSLKAPLPYNGTISMRVSQVRAPVSTRLLITNRYSLDDINVGYQAMRDGENIRGVIVHGS